MWRSGGCSSTCAFGVCRGFPETTLQGLPGKLLGRMRALGSSQRLALRTRWSMLFCRGSWRAQEALQTWFVQQPVPVFHSGCWTALLCYPPTGAAGPTAGSSGANTVKDLCALCSTCPSSRTPGSSWVWFSGSSCVLPAQRILCSCCSRCQKRQILSLSPCEWCFGSFYGKRSFSVTTPCASPTSIPNPGKFGAVAEGVRASVSPLGGSFCTRV